MFDRIIKSCDFVVLNAKDVKINYKKIEILIKEIISFKYQHYLTNNPFKIMELNTEDLINFLLFYDSINFSFWGDPKWSIETENGLIDGSTALLYSMLKIFKKHSSSEVFKYLENITKEEFKDLLKGNIEIPLLEERYTIITNIAKKVNKDMNGNFYNYIKNINNDIELFKLIIKSFDSFKDTRTYNEEEIEFYKLAQILTSDILHMLEFKESIKVDYSHLVGCADYKIPQILRSYGILEYSDILSEIVDNGIEIIENNSFEVEIRASMIIVINYIYERINHSKYRIDINDFIWGKGQDKSLLFKLYHLTRTTSY